MQPRKLDLKAHRLLLLVALILPTAAFAEISIEGSWIRDLPPSMPMRAGYFTIKNSGETDISIKSIHSHVFAKIEIHKTVHADGMMRMEPTPNLKIKAGSSVELIPGGLHLMLMKPKQPVKRGDKIQVEIEFDDGSQQTLVMEVKPKV